MGLGKGAVHTMEACSLLTVQGGLHLRGVSAGAAAVQLVIAVEAAAAAHLKAGHHAVAPLQALHLGADLLHNTHELQADDQVMSEGG